MSDSEKKKIQFKFLQSAQSRVFLAIGLIVLIAAGIGGFLYYRSQAALEVGSAAVAGGPEIQSVPGAGVPSTAYTVAQTRANIAGEVDARKKATSFVPTLTTPEFTGNISQFGQAPEKTTDADDSDATHRVCQIKQVVLAYKPNPASCTPENLALARKTGVNAEELMCQGCSCPALKVAGFTAGDLKKVGLTAEQLKDCGFSLEALMRAGFNAADLKQAGFSASQLAAAGFTPGELAAAGFSPAELAQAYTKAELEKAGLSTSGGAVVCNVAELEKQRAAGVTAAKLRQEGCGLDALKAAGFTAKELKDAGFTATELKNAGFSNAALQAAGFTPAEIKAADEASKNCSVEKLEKERAAGVSATALRQQGCGLEALKAAGFSAAALRAAGFNAQQLKDAGFSAAALRAAGFSAKQLKDAGFSASQLKDAGFSASALKAAGFTAGQLADAGFSAKQLKDAGFDANQLRDAGFSASQLRAAGFSANALRKAGFTNGDLLRAGFSPEEAGYQAAVPEKAVTPVDASESAQQPAEPGLDTTGKAAALPGIEQGTMEGRLAQFQQQEHKELDAQEQRSRIAQMQALMTDQAQRFMTDWSNFSQQQMARSPVEAKKSGTGETETEGGAAGGTKQGAEPQGPVIKAGTILFGVLTTSINSDENSPIMAEVVAGKLKGSRLLGSFTRVNKRLLIRFNLMGNPAYVKSIPINAVAIDPNTARTAISGQVNNHYLLRYGTLFASSFLEGISSAIINQGVTTDCVGGGGLFCVVKTSPLNADQQIAVGLGKVGQSYAQHMGQNFNLPPTIRVSAGSGIGVLIMSDLTLPVAMADLDQHGS